MSANPDSFYTYFSYIPPPALFLLICLALGVISLSLCSRSVSTAFIFFMAVLVSRAAMACFEKDRVRAIFEKYTWIGAGHHELMYTLLPPLVFETAYSIDAHEFRKYLPQVMILGGLCYIVNVIALGSLTYIQMIVVNALLEESRIWPLSTCWLYASMVNAIDPITATTMLHHVGVPHELYTYLEGEALVSDGMAMFTYNVLNVTVAVEGPSYKEIGEKVGLLSIGMVISILIGYTIGRLVAFLLRGLRTDPIRENAVLIIFVYGAFALCKTFHGSSVLGLFSFALSMNAHRRWSNQLQFEANKRIWTTIAFYANCILVVMVALRSSINLTGINLFHPVFALPLALLARACAVFICVPLLRMVSGGRFPYQYACILIWGSVRGGTSLLMAWRKLEVYDAHDISKEPDAAIADLLLWLVGTTVAVGHLYKGLSIKWLAKRLGLAGISRADRDHLENFVSRLNERIREKIWIRKALPSYAEADWSQIEPAALLRLDNEGALAVDLTRADTTGSRDEENEWYAREAVKRACRVHLWSMSHFGSLSLPLRHVQQAMDTALEYGTNVRVDKLFADHQPYNIWRRISPSGGWNPPWIRKLIGNRRSAASDFTRLSRCIMAVAQAIAVAVTFNHSTINGKVVAPKHMVFISGLLGLFNAADLLMCIWNRRRRFQQVYIDEMNVLDWTYLISTPFYLSSIAMVLHLTRICAQECDYFVLDNDSSDHYRLALLGLTGVCWLKLPLAVLLAARITTFEAGRIWQSGDEATFDVLQALISVSSMITLDLKEGELTSIEPLELRQHLIKEQETAKKDAERKLQELYDRRGGTQILVAIKTRRAAFDLLYDAVQSFDNAKHLGELDDDEYKKAMSAVDKLRSKVTRWTCEAPVSR